MAPRLDNGADDGALPAAPTGVSPRRPSRTSRNRATPPPGRRRHRGVQPKDGAPVEVAGGGGEWKSGPCNCGGTADIACKQNKPLNLHKCVCTHDASTPLPNMTCPVRLGAAVADNNAPAIHIIPATGSPHLLPGRDAAAAASASAAAVGSVPVKVKGPHASPAHYTLGFVIFGAAVLLAAVVIWVMWHRSIRARKSQTPRSLSKGPLGSDLFVPNPQYSLGMTSLGLGLLGEATALQQGVGAAAVATIARRALTLQESIGEGCFGKVYRGELRGVGAASAEGGGVQTVAVKVLKESATREAEEDFMREVEVMSAFQHQHILRLIGVVPREPLSAPCMVFEFMPFGDLTEVLRCSSKNPWAPPRPGLPPLTQEALLGVALQIALGMQYLAAQRFVHRDLACRNCLVGHNLSVKIADFGMSRDVYTCDYYKMGGSRALPVRWMSPEALLYGRFTLESDVWSFGVVLWEVFTRGRLPYYGHANDEALRLVLQGVLLQLPDSPECPAAVIDLMRCCWKSEPRDRLRFPEICSRLEEALEEALKGLHLEADHLDLDLDLPRPPGFPAANPALALSLPALPDDLLPLPAAAEDLEGRGPEELLDPENYLLPRTPDPSRVQYMEPVAD